MKRYFIFGFLSILIITLNFAVLILLFKEEVNFNFGVLVLLWIAVIVTAGGMAYYENIREKRRAELFQEKAVPKNPLKPKPEEVSPTAIYKQKTLEKVRISLSPDFNDKLREGFFGGYVVTEEFSNEELQAVYNNDGQLLGFIGKSAEQLCQNLQQLYKEPLICWGKIVWNEEAQHFVLKARVPILYSEPELNRFKKLVSLKQELLEMEAHPEELVLPEYLQKAEDYVFLENSAVTPHSLDHQIDPEVLVRYASDLVEARDWQKLGDLQHYPGLISRLQQPHKKQVLSAIKKSAKKMDES